MTRYDSMSRKLREVLSSSQGVHSVTEYSYDTVGRLACTAVRMNPAAFPPADGGGTLIGACNLGPQGTGLNDYGPDRIVRNVYDLAGQRLQVREGVGTGIEAAEATWAYNLNGQVTTIVDGNGNRAEYRYDGHGRQSRWVFPSPTEPANFDASTPATALASAGSVNENDYEQYGYDPNGNRTSLRLRDTQTIAFQYDNLNRMTLKDLPGTEASVTYAYNLLGAQTSASNGTVSVTNTYDGLNRASSETGYMGTKSYLYDQAGRRSRLTYPGGFAVGYDYLDTGEMTRIRENPAGTNAEIVTLGYDGLGRRTSIGRANGATTAYEYDGAGRLEELSHDLAGVGADVTFAFEYNPSSQITRRTSSNAAYSYMGLANANVVDEHNGLNQITTHGVTGITHDLRGNITNDGARTFTYDSQNRLVHSGGPNNLWLNYDPLGRILSLIHGGAHHEYPDYDGDRMIAEHDGSGVVQRRYVHGPGVDEPLVWYEGATTADRRYHHADERGSVIAISGSTGAALAINRYDEYGIPQGTHTGRFGYTGQAWIERAGIWHYKARMYHPRLGRFMQIDPIGYDDQTNLYAYVGNDPVNFGDVEGEQRGPRVGSGSYPATPYGGFYGRVYRARYSEAQSVWPGSRRYFPTFIGRPTAGDVVQAGATVRAMQVVGPRNINPSSNLPPDPAGAAIQNALHGSRFQPTPGGVPQFFAAATGAGARNVDFTNIVGHYPQFSAGGVAHRSVNLGHGMTAEVTAYRDSSRGSPAIMVHINQRVYDSTSRIARQVRVFEAKIRY